MKIVLGNDHAGLEMKLHVKKWLTENGFDVEDMGTHSIDPVDYPDYAHKVAEIVGGNMCLKGILVCGSGQGVTFTANKHQRIRATLCWTEEIARLSREHNDANILCLPGRFVEMKDAIEITKVFLETSFEGGRHQKRIDKVSLPNLKSI